MYFKVYIICFNYNRSDKNQFKAFTVYKKKFNSKRPEPRTKTFDILTCHPLAFVIKYTKTRFRINSLEYTNDSQRHF